GTSPPRSRSRTELTRAVAIFPTLPATDNRLGFGVARQRPSWRAAADFARSAAPAAGNPVPGAGVRWLNYRSLGDKGSAARAGTGGCEIWFLAESNDLLCRRLEMARRRVPGPVPASPRPGFPRGGGTPGAPPSGSGAGTQRSWVAVPPGDTKEGSDHVEDTKDATAGAGCRAGARSDRQRPGAGLQ